MRCVLPERIGRYRIVERLAEGGMGIVYRAVDGSAGNRPVAVKVIRYGFESKRVLARFEAECSARVALTERETVSRLTATSYDSPINKSSKAKALSRKATDHPRR